MFAVWERRQRTLRTGEPTHLLVFLRCLVQQDVERLEVLDIALLLGDLANLRAPSPMGRTVADPHLGSDHGRGDGDGVELAELGRGPIP